MVRTKWIDRTFTFDYPAGWMFNVLERLRGTTARLTWITFPLKEEELLLQRDSKWSIKEHIGHLLDLEDLHDGRIDDFLSRLEFLRAADMTNRQTSGANHNTKSLESLLHSFSSRRNQFIDRLVNLDEETLYFQSLHPRLKVMMRPIDLAYFTAEHDDHHLASIRELLS